MFAFEATAGVVYQISVDGVNGSAGGIVMQWQAHPHQPPLNDNFTNRIALMGTSISLFASNRFATREPGEPLHAGEPGGASVWWTWTASLTGKARLTVTAPFDVVAGVYLGNSFGTLTSVASGSGVLMFDCVAGIAYQMAVDGVGGASGEFQLELSTTSRPANDRFADRVILSGSAVTVDGTTVAATREPGEVLDPASTTGASVWYSWTAPASGDVTVALAGWKAEQPFSIYVGSVVSNLFLVAQASNEAGPFAVRFYALAGLSYQIAVSDNGGTESAFTLTLNAAPPPPRIQPGALSRRADGAFRLRVLGTNAQSFAIQASTDLVEWNTLAIDTLQGDVVDFVDADAVNLPQRFYRVLPLDAVFTNGPLRLTDPTTYPGGFFALSVRGQAGLPFVLEASEDFENWTRLTARQIAGESFRFGDGDSPASARRFYRARAWP
jgi:hypothetical protein